MKFSLFIVIFILSGLKCFALYVPGDLDVDPRLKKYVPNWGLDQTIIHFNNHINNNNSMMNRILNVYLEDGIPARTVNGVKWKGISAKELRASFDIPEKFWHDPESKSIFKKYIKGFMLGKHDDAKLNTTLDFLEKQDADLTKDERFLKKKWNRKRVLQRNYIISNLDNAFGENPWEADKLPPELKSQMKKAQKDIKFLNTIDDKITGEYLESRSKVSKVLSPKWIKEFLLKGEGIVDHIERWGNPVSILEYKRKMVPESKFEYKMGVKKVRPPCATPDCADFPFRRMLIEVENDYKQVATHFDDYHKAVEKIFKKIEKLGIKISDLDPIKRFEIIPLLQDGQRSLPDISLRDIKRILFTDKPAQFREIFKAGPNKSRAKFEYMSTYERAKQKGLKGRKYAKRLFAHISPAKFMQMTIKSDSSIKKDIYHAVEIGLNKESIGNLKAWEFKNFILGNKIQSCKPKKGVSK